MSLSTVRGTSISLKISRQVCLRRCRSSPHPILEQPLRTVGPLFLASRWATWPIGSLGEEWKLGISDERLMLALLLDQRV